ncbi:MAG: alpha/beta hydrolase [Xanthomonadales bacterium]|nr:alpha/beta hydrolase [Xanthomonadales bacterium]
MNARAEPCQFGNGRGTLFGVFHRPREPRAGVLVLPPFLQEFPLSNRLFALVADVLAQDGIAVLRPHYYGTGDSDGHSLEFSLEQAAIDATAALGALRERIGVTPVAVLGVRAGAFVASALAARARLAALWLWRPLVDGAAYLADLHRIDAEEQASRHRYPEGRRPHPPLPHESLVGYPCGAELISGLAVARLDRDSSRWPPLVLLDRVAQARLPAPRQRIELTSALTAWEGKLEMGHVPAAAARSVGSALAASLAVAA